MSTVVWTFDPSGAAIPFGFRTNELDAYIPDTDKHGMSSSHHRASATNIYRCADGKWFHLHGSMSTYPPSNVDTVLNF
jgi:hypothetical protein